MTRHDDGYRILTKRLRYIARQVAVTETFRDLAVSQRLTRIDAARDVVNTAIEVRRFTKIDFDIAKIADLAIQQFDNVIDCTLRFRRRYRLARIGKSARNAISHRILAAFGKTHSSNAALAPHDATAADRRIEQ